MSTLTLSAQQYPKKILFQGDTLICFTPNQVTTINMIIVDSYECDEMLVICNGVTLKYEELIRSLNSESAFLFKLNENLASHIKILNQISNEKDSIIESQKKDIKRLKFKRLIDKVIIGTTAIIAIYFIVK